MQAAGIDTFGGEVRLMELDAPPSPAADEVVIAVHAAGVGNWDEIARVGGWNLGPRPPLALGVEAAGVVTAVGKNVTAFAPDDEVMTHPVPLRYQGAWAESLVAPAAFVAKKPPLVPWEVAAAFPVPALTADQALADPRGQVVLVNGAGGVTGGLAVQLAVARGASVIATAGPSSAERVRGYGARVVLDYHDRDWSARVRESSPDGRGVATAVNAARSAAATALQAIADNGRLATITGDPPPSERGITVVDVYVEADGERLSALAEELAEGTLSLQVGAKYPLTEAATALERVVTGRVAGASVITVKA